MATIKILFLEDEIALAEIVRETLQDRGFEVNHAHTIAAAIRLYTQNKPDIIVVDVMLPDGSGFDWIASLRKSDSVTPVIFLTALSQTADVVKGFEIGGNDYLKKPFSIAELIVRIQSLLKRNNHGFLSMAAEARDWKIGKYTFRYPAGELSFQYHIRQLTTREAEILQLLLMRRNESLSRQDILQTLWGNSDYFSGRSLDVFISRLRGYLRKDPTVKILNFRGIGYKIIG